MYRKIVLLLILFLVNGFVLLAQNKELGVFKPGTKWENINTRSINVVYPSGYDSVANRVINITKFIHDYKLESIGDKNANRKLQIILAPNDLSNNLQIQLAPYKAIIPTTGPQNIMDIGGVDWLTQSSIFAYRRALQYSNLNSGVFRIIYWLNGDQGVQNLSSFTIPSWFFEGDATFSQTTLTKAGIGYTPSFNRQQRARVLKGKKYRYPKARNGSFIDVIEKEEVYGVSLIEQGRKIAGPDVWKKVIRSSANLHGIFYSFSNSTKKHIGFTTRKLYSNTYDSLEVKFQNEIKHLQLTEKNEVVASNKRFYENYSCLNITKDRKLYALKRPLQKIPRIVEILPNKEEKTIVRLPKDFNEQFSIHNGWIVWSEKRDNPFYKHLDYHNIFSYNLYTKEKKQLSEKKKYFSPALSTDGKTIAVIEKDANFNRYLVTLDRKTGNELKKFSIIKHGDAFSPQWSYDNTKVLYILQADSK
ncbi:hypothetical protein K4L44_06350 [Halosquirtibacter laminarini]|uniref:Uncharacterized protein n=1 Tax=Halosquirtibacter laminarini TaxID=3374600 RepID=A0AC61NKV2_9BACT|nr:hypothetical protein K4L44_06350 [Prolixibacteraceae bacterium]